MSYDNNMPPVGYDGYSAEGPDTAEADYQDWFNSLDDTLGTLALAERMDREGLPTE